MCHDTMERKTQQGMQPVTVSQKLKNDKHGPLRGTCLTMCPNDELRLRQRENLIHPLECKVNQKGQRLEFADPKRMVKEFSRSAAGRQIKPSDVRPLPVLQKTVIYLLCVVCSYEDVSWREIYDFVNDRLRAVRQDITLQGLQGKEVVKILAPVARFYIYAHYRLCECETSEFDPCLNLQQLNEILLTLLSIYKTTPDALDSETLDYRPKNIVSKEGCNQASNEEVTNRAQSLSKEESSPNVPDSKSELSEVTSDAIVPEDSHLNNSTSEGSPTDSEGSPTNHEASSADRDGSHGDPANISTTSDDGETYENTNEVQYSNIRHIPASTWEKERENGFYSVVKTSDRVGPTFENLRLDKHTVTDEMISLYVLIHIGSPEIVSSLVEMPQMVRRSPLVSRVIAASLNWMAGNHIPLIRLTHTISPVLAAAIHLHLNKVQRHALGVLSVAHNSKVIKYPTEDLRRYLHFSSVEMLQKVCQHYGLPATADGVQFTKSSFKWEAPVYKPEKVEWLNNKLKNFTVSELLVGFCMDSG